MSSTLEHDPRVVAEQQGLRGFVASLGRRLREGDVGQLPVLLGLAVIAIIFERASDGLFLTPFNMVNLTSQMAAIGTMSVGVVLILLLGEIDLSVGIVSGMCASVMAVLTVIMDVSPAIGLGLGILTGTAVGLFQGAWITTFGIPSFVVTLSGLIGWQGLLLHVLGKNGTINLQDPLILGLANTYLRGTTAYAAALAFLAYVAGGPIVAQLRRRRAGLAAPMSFVVARAVVVSAAVLGAVFALDRDRGVALSLVFLLGLIVVMDFVLRRTRLGRMIYAIGGNAEAARRAGLPVQRIRVLVFVLASTLAAWGGMLAASRLRAVNQSAGQGQVLLNAIAAAVIGGTSLFGGRGTVWSALFGILVIQSISNGMDMLSLQNSIKMMVTAGVLLAAVTIDAILRRGRQASGR
jgi:D-xylose transport system permease protein